ncbi:hypothetical protein [uncultured Cedecea sp.]|uniref:hypothetical protein n=1 Tax=uncultured Cedecea sp. TaxID=988762 RepID=UPI002633EE47|nr:hypothetical protein [uncultured Cedecea sp.]
MKRNKIALSLITLLMTSSYVSAENKTYPPAIITTTNDSRLIKPLSIREPSLFNKMTNNNEIINPVIHEKQGYIIEHGNFKNAETKESGSIVIVSSPNGDIVAIVDSPDKRGLFSIDTERKLRFIAEEPSRLYKEDDVVPVNDSDFEKISSASSDNSKSIYDIEFLAGYSSYALKQLDTDPVGYALAQLETAREGLKNSNVNNVNLLLGGIVIFNKEGEGELSTSSEGLRYSQEVLQPFRALYQTDINMVFATVETGVSAGRAYMPGYTSINAWNTSLAFRHELGHNVGGNHCNDNGSDNYKFGYNNSLSRTFLCGNSSPYYSTPDVIDSNGLPLGDVRTADMARLWREQAARMANYNVALEGMKLIFASNGKSNSAELTIPLLVKTQRAGIIALDSDIGPTTLIDSFPGGYTVLNVPLTSGGEEYNVKFRAQRSIGSCNMTIMNSQIPCLDGLEMHFIFTYHPEDNKELPPSLYNGLLQLKAISVNNPEFSTPLNITIALDNTN